MNYYPFHLGDYAAHTAHLEPMEDLAYRRMLDLYYRTEKPLPHDWREIARLIRLKDVGEAIECVLAEFFTLQDDGWHSARADEELAKYQAMVDGGRSGAAKRWAKGGDAPPMPTQLPSDSPPNGRAYANQEPRTKNQEPKEREARASRFALTDLPDLWFDFCKTERPDLDPAKVFAAFSDYWRGIGGAKGRKLDWDATWRNWVRNESTPRVKLADIARVTVPGPTGRDPALIKAEEDFAKAAPMPAFARELAARLTGKANAQ